MGQDFLQVLRFSSVTKVSPLLHTASLSFIYRRRPTILAVGIVFKQNSDLSFHLNVEAARFAEALVSP
jgi:hypothetical protein